MKGFKDPQGKFRPTENKNGVSKSRDQKLKLQGIRLKREKKNQDGSQFKKIKVWTYEDAPKELKVKILENWRNKYSGTDQHYADYDGFIYSKEMKIDGDKIFKGANPSHWNVGYGHRWIQFAGLEVKDKEKFAQGFEIPKSLLDKIDFDFNSERDNKNTELIFRDVNGNKIELYDEYEPITKRSEFIGNFYLVEPEDVPTREEWEIMKKATEKFDRLMDESARHLEASYESEFEDEPIIDTIEANDYTFNKDGEIENI